MIEALLVDADGSCGASCACHGGYVCARAKHPHEAGNSSPHVAVAADGSPVQWEHHDGHGPVLTAEQVADAEQRARMEHTRALLATLDLDMLREVLGHASQGS